MVPVIIGITKRELLGTDIKTLDNDVFKFYQTVFLNNSWKIQMCKIIMDHKHQPRLRHLLGKIRVLHCPSSYDSVIGMILYLALNTRSDISFDVHPCERFTNNIME